MHDHAPKCFDVYKFKEENLRVKIKFVQAVVTRPFSISLSQGKQDINLTDYVTVYLLFKSFWVLHVQKRCVFLLFLQHPLNPLMPGGKRRSAKSCRFV